MSTEKKKKVTIVIPTYNERENIEEFLSQILRLRLLWDPSIIVVDDDSPDGTAEVVSCLAQKEKNIHLLLRKGKRGRGSAGIEGFKKALSLGPEYIMEMDADFSHCPDEIPRLLEAAPGADIVIGSRFVPGGKDAERSFGRKLLTFLVRFFLRAHLRVPVRDITSGFRCFKKEVLEGIDLGSLKSRGPSIVQEVLYKAFLLGYRIKEVPITFKNRKRGATKLTFSTLWETLIFNWNLKKSIKASLQE